MSTNPDHINQLAAIIREVDGGHNKGAADLAEAILDHPRSMWQPPATLAQPEGEGPHDLTRKLLYPAYEPGDGSADDAQQVNLAWWHPLYGSDSLQVVVDNACYLLTCRSRPAALPPLPPNYIDPEHQGEDLELLLTFYQACQAEGGTADEIHLRGIRAVLAARPAAPPASEVGLQGLHGKYIVWRSADFSPVKYPCFVLRVDGRDDAAMAAIKTYAAHPDCPPELAADLTQTVRQNATVDLRRTTAPPAPEAGELGELVAWMRSQVAIAPAAQTQWAKRFLRAATLLQQQSVRIVTLRSALADCGRAVGASIADDCSDDFLLEVPAEVRLAAAKPAPAVVPVAVSERLPDPRPEAEGGDCDAEGRCWIHQPRPESPETPEWRLAQAIYASTNYGTTHWVRASDIPLPQAREVQSLATGNSIYCAP